MCGTNPCDKPSCTWSQAHMLACEIRTVMRWPKEARNAFYADVLKKRGPAALAELREGVNREWKISQQQPLLL